MAPADWIIYYSPVEIFGSKQPCRKFTALGQITSEAPYQVCMTPSFVPWRHDVTFKETKSIAIEPLIDTLSFIKNKQQWGFPFRRGCFEISAADFGIIAEAMGITVRK